MGQIWRYQIEVEHNQDVGEKNVLMRGKNGKKRKRDF